MKSKASAEEKHYMKLNLALRQDINRLKAELNDLKAELNDLRNANKGLESLLLEEKGNNSRLMRHNDFLTETSNFSREEIEQLFDEAKKQKNIEELASMFIGLLRFGGY
jgi:putative IMPACT (imprinted ancient) family translation regulator